MSGYIHSKWLFLQELSVERWRKEALFEGRNRNSFTFLHCSNVLLKMLRNKQSSLHILIIEDPSIEGRVGENRE